MQFSKMHGLGNDFIIIDSITQNIHLNKEMIKHLSNRYYGIGCNQLLIIEPPYDPEIDFHCKIYNADGTEVNQCGNGIRCCAKFVHMKKLTNKKQNIRISTRTNHMILSIKSNDYISVKIQEPIFDPMLIPFYASQYQKHYILFVPEETILCSVVSLGNPHCIILVEEKTINTKKIIKLGEQLEKHHRFPKGANISFMQIINQNHIKLRVYERSVGETQACGSAACAAVAVGIKQKILMNKVNVNLPGGTLSISWNGTGHPLYMSGTANHSYDGIIHI